MGLSERLKCVIRRCRRGTAVADVGCDHGLVPLTLVREGAFLRAIAMDVRPGPLARASANIREAGLEDRIETRLSDGLEALAPGEADVIVIAGMGGALMCGILQRGEKTAKAAERLVLSPQSELPAFRRFLTENGYRIAEEEMLIEDEKEYHVIEAVPGMSEPWSEAEYIWGRQLLDRSDPVLLESLRRRKHQIEEILRSLEGKEGCRAEARRGELQEELLLCRASEDLMKRRQS